MEVMNTVCTVPNGEVLTMMVLSYVMVSER